MILRQTVHFSAYEFHSNWLNNPLVNQYLECRWKKWTVSDVMDCWSDWEQDLYKVAGWILYEGDPVGTIKVVMDPHNMCCDVGYMIGNPDHWGRGLATKALKSILRHPAIRPMRCVYAGVHSSNHGSRRVLEKCGFKHVATEPMRLIGPHGVDDRMAYMYDPHRRLQVKGKRP